MEEHLLEDISVDDIASASNFSPFHFQRTFALLTGVTVGEYLRRRRLTQATYDLGKTDMKIIEIALKYGFDSPEAFSKAFRRQHGMSPSQARKNEGKLKSYNRLVIQVNLKGAEPMNYRIEEKEEFHFIGMKRNFLMENGEPPKGIPEFWDEVNESGADEKLWRLNDGAVKGVLGVCVDQGAGSIDYWIGVAHEAEYAENSDTLEKMTVPAAKWAVFEVHGAMPNAMVNTWKKIYSEWFPTSEYEYAGGPEFELYTEDDPFSENCYSEIWIPVK
ncbi:AraC family transcriptional regulator [Halalkalibacillus sediminis]|uniref:AraC family transcriptional regulator n=2 Tax=Halalkalibacillus sediminis TaxID=2018042 RepID=A0A2I0QYD2_9BACI|nr:AraC family transcriptional regulator [Halalkalibacillus sediminis]